MKWESILEKIAFFSEYDKERVAKALKHAKDTGYAEGAGAIALKLGLDVDCAVALILLAAPEGADTAFNAGFYQQTREIAREYGETVAALVTGLKKAGRVHIQGKSLAQAESARKMLFALVADLRILFMKLAERLQTLRCARNSDEVSQKKLAEECLGIYAPLAGRLGISWLKDEIEDLSLKYLNRGIYNQIKEIVAFKKNERQHILLMIEAHIKEEARKNKIRVDVSSRAKHFYSIYQKMRKHNKSPETLFDLLGIRIFCETIEDCYVILSIIHKRWRQIENRFKDYIANPKPNGYQSLHTTISTGEEGIPDETCTEVQIRTFDMHYIAEHGIASHWLYKKGNAVEIVDEKHLPMINKLKNALHESSQAFLANIKREILMDSVFVFTPHGMVVELPAGATALDFAYSIHQAVGEHCLQAKADGKIIPLSKPLENTQVIEIITAQSAHPHENWLSRVKTSKALNRIRHWLALNGEGDPAAAKHKPKPDAPRVHAHTPPPRGHEHKPPHQHAAHTGQHTVRQDDHHTEREAGHNAGHQDGQAQVLVPVRIQDDSHFLVRFARCCNPAPGDPITGFVSRGRGIIIHRQNCSNLEFIKEFEERKINAEWDYQMTGHLEDTRQDDAR